MQSHEIWKLEGRWEESLCYSLLLLATRVGEGRDCVFLRQSARVRSLAVWGYCDKLSNSIVPWQPPDFPSFPAKWQLHFRTAQHCCPGSQSYRPNSELTTPILQGQNSLYFNFFLKKLEWLVSASWNWTMKHSTSSSITEVCDGK